MKTCINISYPNKVRFRKRFTAKHLTMFGSFLNLFSKRPREKKGKEEKKKKRRGKRLILNRYRRYHFELRKRCSCDKIP